MELCHSLSQKFSHKVEASLFSFHLNILCGKQYSLPFKFLQKITSKSRSKYCFCKHTEQVRDVFTLCYKKRFGFLAPFQTIPAIYYYQIRRDHYYCDSNLLHTYYLTSICIFESGGRVFSNAD